MGTVDFSEDVFNHLQKRIFKATYCGKNCYVKLLGGSKRNRFHRLQKMIFGVTRIPLLAPTLVVGEENGIVHEAEKLGELKKLGLNVPAVYSYSQRYLILEDCGRSLPEIIREKPGQTQVYLEMAIRELGKLHRNGQCHGGAQIRNFTLKNDEIYLIDFEEETQAEYFEGIFFRDIVLFLTSVMGCGIFSFSLPDLITAYEQSSQIKIWERLVNLANRGRLLELVTMKPFVKWCGKDLLAVNRVFEQIRLLGGAPNPWQHAN